MDVFELFQTIKIFKFVFFCFLYICLCNSIKLQIHNRSNLRYHVPCNTTMFPSFIVLSYDALQPQSQDATWLKLTLGILNVEDSFHR